ncbi:MAG: ABC transporter substrate-binding protein [Bacillota bacterium]
MKKMIILMTITIIIFTFTGCSLQENTQEMGEVEEGIDYFIFDNAGITLPLTSFQTLNPLYMDNLSYYHFSKLIFEGLFEYDENIQPVPRLASTYTVSDDGMTVDVSLRADVLWHNGEKLVADDIVFTVEMMKKAGLKSYYGKLVQSGIKEGDMNIISASALSDGRVQISFSRPTGNILDMLTFPIIPQTMGTQALATEEYFPIGTGPYRFVEHMKFKEIHLESNQDYREGEPQISYITGKIFDDRESILTAFETGKLDMAPTIGVDWDKYEHNERIAIYEYVSGNYEALIFNHREGVFSTEAADSIKKAIMYGIDRQSIIDKVFLQHGTQVDTPIHPSSYLVSTNVDRYGYNVENAEDILKTAGYSDKDGDGILEDSEGNPLSVSMLINKSSDLISKVAEMISDNIGELGISVEFVYPSGGSIEETQEDMRQKLVEGDYDISIIQWEQSTVPGLNTILAADSPGNFSYYSSEELIDLLLSLETTWDHNSKLQTYQEFQGYFVDNLPYGSMFFRNKALLVDSGIAGPLEPIYYNLYNGLEKCYLTMSTN